MQKKRYSQAKSEIKWLALYALLAIGLTWPTVSRLTTHLPGDGGDDPAIAWNLWWVKYALLNAPQNPLHTDFMFYPIGINLAFYTLTTLNALTALPLTLNLGVVAASNLHLLFTFVCSGYGTFLLARYLLGGHKGSAALAGLFYAFAGSKLFYAALGQFNIASAHWIPWAVLYIIRSRRQPAHLKNSLMAGLFLTMQAWAEMTYASFLVIFIGLYWLYEGMTGRLRPASIWPHLRAAAVMGGVFGLGLSPLLAQMLPDMLAEGDFLVEGSGFAERYSADLFGFIVPTVHHPWLGQLVGQSGITDFDKGQHIYLGVVLLGLLLIGLIYRPPRLGFWLAAAGVFALLSLGPMITVNGYETGLPGPFIILQKLPFFKGNRYPSRYSVMLILCLSMVAASVLARPRFCRASGDSPEKRNWTVRLKGRRRAVLLGLVGLLFLVEHLSLPLPQSDLRVPAPYDRLARQTDPVTLLDLPLAWRNGFRITGALTPQFMFGQFYQTAHQNRLLQGNTSRNPAFKFQYFTEAPIINSLLALERGHRLPPERLAADRAIAAETLRFFGIRYVAIRPYSFAYFDGENQITVTEKPLIAYVEETLPVEKIDDGPGLKLYRVEPGGPEAAGRLIETTDPLASLYFGEGWGLLTPGQPVAAQRREARLFLPLSGQERRITLRLSLPELYRAKSQSLSLALNGWRSPPRRIERPWREYSFEPPAAAIRPGLNEMRLYFGAVSPLPRPGGATGEITVLSAGEEVGDFGHIYVNGYDISANQRGYNLARLYPDRIETAVFDTHGDSAAATELVRFLQNGPEGAILAGAVADEASFNLNEAAVMALQPVADLRGCFRCSQAFIITPTAAYQALDPLGPVGLTTGLGLTEGRIAALLESIRVE